MKQRNQVILVDQFDQKTGIEEKLKAHQLGLRHRAFSVFIFFKAKNELTLLLQQRQHDKYHCGGLWTNSCCSHPQPGEEIIEAGEDRLYHELGIQVPLIHAGEFQYTAHFDNGLTENEYDHVLIGFSQDQQTKPNPHEVAAVQWLNIDALQLDLAKDPHKYTPWFEKALRIALSTL